MKKKFLLFLVLAFLFGMVSQAGALTLTFDYLDGYYVGSVTNAEPANPTDEVSYINNLRVLAPGTTDTADGRFYDRSLLPGPLPEAVLAGSDKYDGGNTFDATGFEYIWGKFGQDGNLWYLGENFIGDVTLPTSGLNQNGLSHISAYNHTPSVPEPSTMFLLGIGLVGLVGCSRKVRK